MHGKRAHSTLAGFSTLATVLEFRQSGARPAWIVQGTGAIVAASFAFATHHLLPFLFALFIAVFVIEFTRARGFSQQVWPLMALVTDLPIWGMIFIYRWPQSARGEYSELPAISTVIPGCILFAISATSVIVRVFLTKTRMGIADAVQLLSAYLLAVEGVLFSLPAYAEMLVGTACLAFAAAVYPATFLWLKRLAAESTLEVSPRPICKSLCLINTELRV